MHIVHCVFEMETGGSQVLVVDLLNEMCKSHTVSLIIINNQYNKSLLQQLDNKINIHYFNRRQGSYNPLPFVRLNRLLHTLQPQIIHCHEYITSRYLRVRTGKLVNTVHLIGLPTTYYHHYQLVVGVSTSVFHDIISRCRCTAVTMICNGINAVAFRQRQTHTPEATGTWRLVQVSRLVHDKGHDILLHALHRMVYDYGITNISLDLIGSGDALPYLQSLTIRLKLHQYVYFLGDTARSWLFDHLADYHLLVQPSRVEPFGLAILEGIAAGLPVLASNGFGPAEILPGIPASFLFETGDIAGCARQIDAILTLYKNNRISALIKPSVDRVKNKFSMQSCAAAYLEAYAQLAGNP